MNYFHWSYRQLIFGLFACSLVTQMCSTPVWAMNPADSESIQSAGDPSTPESPKNKKRLRYAKTPGKIRSKLACGKAISIIDSGQFTDLTDLGNGDHANVVRAKYNGEWMILKIMNSDVPLHDAQQEYERQQRAAQIGVAPQVTLPVFCYERLDEEYFYAFGIKPIAHSLSLTQYMGLAKPSQTLKDQFYNFIVPEAYKRLAALHQTEMGHNDLAPENILIVAEDEYFNKVKDVLLIDFGVFDDDEGHSRYFTQESLTVHRFDRDFISLSMITAGESNPKLTSINRTQPPKATQLETIFNLIPIEPSLKSDIQACLLRIAGQFEAMTTLPLNLEFEYQPQFDLDSFSASLGVSTHLPVASLETLLDPIAARLGSPDLPELGSSRKRLKWNDSN